MPTPPLPEPLKVQALQAFQKAGGDKTKAAVLLGLPASTYRNRLRQALEQYPHGVAAISGTRIPQRVRTTIKDGVAVAFSDAHFWPDERSIAHEAFLKLAPLLKPVAVFDVGDSLDGASISRHPMMGNDELPTPREELFAVLEQRGEMMEACPGARLYWNPGNHCLRWDGYLATHAEKMKDLPGATLKENLPGWTMAYSLEVNWGTDPLLVLHNFKGGVHAGHNNVVATSVHVVSGHDHAQGVARYTNERGTFYGINPGVFADPNGPQFRYTRGRPKNWRSGFAVLTFKDGMLLPPELVEVVRGVAYFRGQPV